jgi:hypothetical protein
VIGSQRDLVSTSRLSRGKIDSNRPVGQVARGFVAKIAREFVPDTKFQIAKIVKGPESKATV